MRHDLPPCLNCVLGFGGTGTDISAFRLVNHQNTFKTQGPLWNSCRLLSISWLVRSVQAKQNSVDFMHQEKKYIVSFRILQLAIKQVISTQASFTVCRLAWRRRRSSQHGLHWFHLGLSPAPSCLPRCQFCLRACRWVHTSWIELLRATSWFHINWVTGHLCKGAVAPDRTLPWIICCEALCCSVNTLMNWSLSRCQPKGHKGGYWSCYTAVMWLSVFVKKASIQQRVWHHR